MTHLPTGWASVRIGDLIAGDGKFADGDWVETKDQDPGGDVRLTQLADIGEGAFRDRSSRFMTSEKAAELGCTFLVPGDVLVARMPDPLGRACIFPGDHRPCVTAVDVCIIRPGSGGVEEGWLMWWINAPQFRHEILARQAGTTRKRISRKNLASIEFPLPPVPEQQRILARIEQHFSRLDAAQQIVEKARSRLRILRSAVLARILEESWPKACIGDVAFVGSGATPKRGREDYWLGGTIPWVTSGQLTKPFVREPAALITEKALGETNVKLWPKHTLLVALYGEGKTRGHCSELLIEATTNQACAAIILRDDSVDRAYLKLFFAASYDANRRLAWGGVQPNLSLGLIKSLRFPLPPLDEQRRIVTKVEQQLSIVDSMASAIDGALRRSKALRRAILGRAFTGQLVLQDPTDEPALVLLKRIAADRAAAAKLPQRKSTVPA
jgi:type I restriction enzyme S subunit